MSTLENLKTTRAAIVALEKIRENCDPASGVSFSVRRGVVRDNEDCDDDHIRRPWVTVEVSDTAGKQAIATLLTALHVSEKYWIHSLGREINEASEYLKAATQEGGAQ